MGSRGCKIAEDGSQTEWGPATNGAGFPWPADPQGAMDKNWINHCQWKPDTWA